MRRAVWCLVALAACTPATPEPELASSQTPTDAPPPPASAHPTAPGARSTSEPRFERCPIVLDDEDRAREWPAIGHPMTVEPVSLPPSTKTDPDAQACRRRDEEACLRLARALHGRGQRASDAYHLAADVAFDRRLSAAPPTKAPPSAPTDVAGALKAFRTRWYHDVLPHLDPKEHSLPHDLADCMAGDFFFTVSPIEHRLAHRMTYMLVRSQQEGGEHFLLHGTLEDLVGDGDLWMVFYGGSLPDRPPSSSFAAYVDADTGEVLAIVELPEG